MKITGRRSAAATRIGPVGKSAGRPRNVHHLPRGLCRCAIGQHADEVTSVEGVADAQHGLEMSERDDLGRVGGIAEQGRDGVGLLLVHGHRHAQSRLTPAHRAHHLEAAQVRPEQERALAARRRRSRISSSPSIDTSNSS